MVEPIENKLSDKAVLDATGRHPDEWFALLDAQQATAWTHTKIARWLVEGGVDGWWAQGVTVRYEQARGMRQPGQTADGTFEATVSRTIPGDQGAALDRVIASVASEHGPPVAESRDTKYLTARWKPESGGRLLATASPSKGDKTSVNLAWSKLMDAASIDHMKAHMTDLLEAAQ
jgi:hypothetical protein